MGQFGSDEAMISNSRLTGNIDLLVVLLCLDRTKSVGSKVIIEAPSHKFMFIVTSAVS